MNSIDAPTKPVRYPELDSLRGLAALIVVLHHLRIAWESDIASESAILSALLARFDPFGIEAVILFFVLSGFVLSLPAVNGRPQSYFTFVTRRVFRIYVPYVVALAASVAGAFWLHGPVTRSWWIHLSWTEPVSWRLVGQHLLFLGDYSTNEFDNPIWSLVHEMRISLVFPILCGFVLRLKSGWSLLIAFGLSITSIVIQKWLPQIPSTVAESIQYSAFFVLGIFLARERNRLGLWVSRLRGFIRLLIGVAALWLFLFAGSQIADLLGHFSSHGLIIIYISEGIAALGAACLIIISLSLSSWKRVLFLPPIHFLGQVSYSLYLWHVIVILYVVHLFYGKLPLEAILCISFVLSMLVSWISYRLVEMPSMNLGCRLSNLRRLSRATATV